MRLKSLIENEPVSHRSSTEDYGILQLKDVIAKRSRQQMSFHAGTGNRSNRDLNYSQHAPSINAIMNHHQYSNSFELSEMTSHRSTNYGSVGGNMRAVSQQGFNPTSLTNSTQSVANGSRYKDLNERFSKLMKNDMRLDTTSSYNFNKTQVKFKED